MKRWQKTIVALYWLATPMIVAGVAQIVSGLPFTLTNGTVADATQVMADFNQIVNNVNANGAKNGVNSDITALTALSTPLTPAQGGTTVFIANATTGGSANAQTIAATTPSSFALTSGYTVSFLPGFTNTAATTLTVNATTTKNVFKQSFSGSIALAGGEIRSGVATQAVYDGTQFVLLEAPVAFGVATNLASGGTVDLGTAASHVVQITGNTGISAFGSTAQLDFPLYYIRFSSSPVLNHNGTSLILPGLLSITASANDTAIAQYLGSGNWQVVSYTRASTPPIGVAPTVCTIKTTAAVTCSGGQANANNGTYTPTTGATRIRVRVVAGGGGGGAVITNPGAAGVDTSFGSWTAIHGNGGNPAGAGGGAGGTGGAAGTGTLVARIAGGPGGQGQANSATNIGMAGGAGGSTMLGLGGGTASGGSVGNAAAANSGGGGSGAGGGNSQSTGGGGGGGEYVEFWVSGPGSTSYAVGTGGAPGAAGTVAGGAGGSGVIIVEEFYW